MMATPFEWMQAVAGCALASLDETTFGAPDLVEYGDMISQPDSGKCAALYIDGGQVFEADKERWPNRVDPTRQITSIGKVCEVVPTSTVKLTYVHCVPTIDGAASRPSSKARNESAENMWDAAWKVWEGFSCCLPTMRRAYGKVIRQPLAPLPRQGGLSGFTIEFTVALTNCPDCTPGGS